VPAVLLGRLAIAKTVQGKGPGGALLADALMRTARAELGVFAMLVDAKDEPAQRFHERFGFTLLRAEAWRLVLPVATAANVDLLKARAKGTASRTRAYRSPI
jgi:predicted N-acetyltransferase YhbS